MDKNAIKKFAVWARRELIARVSQKAEQYGITEKNTGDVKDESVNGRLLTQIERSQRSALISHVRQDGFQQVMEEVAYTWFNRFCALRFMEVNNYLPTRIRVFTDEENAFKPQILAEAIHMEMDGLDMDKVYQLKSDNKTEELYKYLLITQCNALYSILPGMFQQIADYTELLLPDNLLREGSVIEQMISLIPEEDWLVPEDHDKDSIQIIGWLYQYYNAEPKDQVFANLKKNIKISKHDIPAATQLFTPDWIVRYMVENSLGRLWVEGHPDDELKAGWKYYLEEAEQEPDVQAQLAKIREEYAAIKPEDIKCIDPCMGSGHILVYMFDVLVQIYQAYGYSTREAVQSIIENNLYGLDIDDRAAQLAYFAVMMKARQYDRRFFTRNIQPHVCAIQESAKMPEDAWDYFNAEKDIAQRVYMAFADAKEYGSLIEPNVTLAELDALDVQLTEMDRMADYGNLAVQALLGTILSVMEPLMKQARMLVQKYDAVVTNPPYMGASGMGPKLLDYVKDAFPDSKGDMSTCFMERTIEFCTDYGRMAMINIPVWMFLSSYEQLRKKLIRNNRLINMVHPGRGIFGSDFGTTAFVIGKKYIRNYLGSYRRLFEKQGEVDSIEEREQAFLIGRGHFTAKQEEYSQMPGSPIAYWVSAAMLKGFRDGTPLYKLASVKQGIKTGDNSIFLRMWHEIGIDRFSRYASCAKWFPCTKGGDFRKWYGNNEYVVDWEHDGLRIRNFRDENGKQKSRPQNLQYMLKEGLTYTNVSSSKFGIRYNPAGSVFDATGSMIFADDIDLFYLLGILSSNVIEEYAHIISPNITFEVGQVNLFPLLKASNDTCISVVHENIGLSKTDWDSFETSWDFVEHPFIRWSKGLWEATNISASMQYFYGYKPDVSCPLELCFMLWQGECNKRFEQLKANEEEINRIFIDIYGLQNELTSDVADKDVTIRKADLGRDIRSFISYAVGCMFGRYSLSKPGLAFAGGEWNAANYISEFQPDKDGILPISDDDYFTDDIVGRFVRFVEVVYGKETLEENLTFIAKALGGSGTPRDVIRSYFLNDFYADHLKIYQKRPIYWLFDSGKKNSFKALIYMHRYAPDTIARIRTDYVHEQQSRYRTAIADLENRIISASTGERVKLTKQLTKVKAQDEELRLYEEKIHHLADQMISIDLDDGVKVNYAKFADVLAKVK